jgi:hypothetical protein
MGQEAGGMKRAWLRSIGAGLCMAFWSSVAHPNDRPFLLTSSAAAEEDDDRVWALETWWQRAGAERSFSVAPEYAFDPTNSIQLELAGGSGKARSAELELKHLFNHIAREGWGWGIDVSLTTASAEGSGWKWQRVSAKLPWSLALRDGEAMLHVNAGVQKQRDDRREWVGSLAFEHKLPWRTRAFVELGREDRKTQWHAGARHWIKREKLALDLGVLRSRTEGDKANGIVIGLGWYDL